MPSQLPSGRWRPRIRHPRTGKHLNPAAVIGGPESYATAEAAAAAEDRARKQLRQNARLGVTVREWWEQWTTDPNWLRPAESTNLHNRERTTKFVEQYGPRPICSIGDDVVASWLRGGRNRGTVPALRAMFNDAASAAAGRLTDRNPWANLGLRGSRGRRDTQPPSQAAIARLLTAADELTPPSFAAYLDTAAHEGARPGELDALKWEDLDFTPGAETIRIERQWNAKVRKFTPPKHGFVRTVAMTDVVRDRLLVLPRESEFVFTTLRGTHYTPSSRNLHWNRARCSVGLGNVDLYTCSRHYFGWYALNVLGLDPHVIALHFGHRDGGDLVRTNYGHPDARIARERVREAFAAALAGPVPLAARGRAA